jgi:hypothetical protein
MGLAAAQTFIREEKTCKHFYKIVMERIRVLSQKGHYGTGNLPPLLF